MRDVELYRQLLRIEAPWEVQQVKLSVSEQRVDVMVGHAKGVRWPCPECGAELSCFDHAEQRAWRHLDSCGFLTWLHARPPRVCCPATGCARCICRGPSRMPLHGAVRAPRDRCAQGDRYHRGVQYLHISWDEGWHLMERAVARGMARKERRVPGLMGVDEKAAAKGQRYLTLVCDLESATVEYIADERKQASLDGYFEALTEAERAQIKAVAMDMWEPYVNSVCAYLPDPEEKIVFDRFHIMKHMVESVDTVRKREHRALSAEGLDLLAGSKYLWLYSQENLPSATRSASPRSRRPTSRPAGRGRSRKACARCGTTTASAGRDGSTSAGTSGPPTHD